ncbi:hypothetical protein Tco_0675530 [Tanacetum coccineum]
MEVFSLLLTKNVLNADKFKFYYGCKALQLTNMCFADDLVVLCNGDVKSVGVIKKTMDQFSSISGLFPNMGKNTIFFRSVPLETQRDILQVLPVQIGQLPMKYLGAPLIAKKLGVMDCKSLVDKVSVKINCWKNKMLTYAGNNLVNSFYKESSWVKWVNVVKLKRTSIWDIEISHGDSCEWKKLLGLRSNIKNHVFYSVGSGKNVSMWFDRWDIKGPLLDIIQRRVWYEERYIDNEKVADMIERGESDKVLWLDNQNEKKEFSTRQAWNDLRENVDKVEWHHVEKDSHAHLFFKCEFLKKVWGTLRKNLNNTSNKDDLKSVLRMYGIDVVVPDW